MSENETSDEDLEIDVYSNMDRDYYWASSPDEARRCFVFQMMVNAEYGHEVMLTGMEAFCRWIKDGKLPKLKVKNTPHLKVIENDRE